MITKRRTAFLITAGASCLLLSVIAYAAATIAITTGSPTASTIAIAAATATIASLIITLATADQRCRQANALPSKPQTCRAP